MEVENSLDGHSDGPSDVIYLKNYRYEAIVGSDCWGRKKPQQIVTSIRITSDTSDAGQTDDIGMTVNYGQVAKNVSQMLREEKAFVNFVDLNVMIKDIVTKPLKKTPNIYIKSVAPKGLLKGAIGCESWLGSQSWRHITTCDSLSLSLVIGVNDHEKLARQQVLVHLRFLEDGNWPHGKNLKLLITEVLNDTETKTFKLIETLAEFVAERLLRAAHVEKVTVSVEKPNALAAVDFAGVEITRSRNEKKS